MDPNGGGTATAEPSPVTPNATQLAAAIVPDSEHRGEHRGDLANAKRL